jgi:hypothetical protein
MADGEHALVGGVHRVEAGPDMFRRKVRVVPIQRVRSALDLSGTRGPPDGLAALRIDDLGTFGWARVYSFRLGLPYRRNATSALLATSGVLQKWQRCKTSIRYAPSRRCGPRDEHIPGVMDQPSGRVYDSSRSPAAGGEGIRLGHYVSEMQQ